MQGDWLFPVTRDDQNLAEGSLETDVCVMPKEKATEALEPSCRKVLGWGRSLVGDESFGHYGSPVVIIPVIVTNAKLVACRLDPGSVDVGTGEISLKLDDCAEDARVGDRRALRFRREYLDDWLEATVEPVEVSR